MDGGLGGVVVWRDEEDGRIRALILGEGSSMLRSWNGLCDWEAGEGQYIRPRREAQSLLSQS